jgi:hypothetical protein
MKKLVLLLLFSITILFNSCKDDKEDPTVPNRIVFKFTYTLGNPTDDYWVILHDNDNGDLIGAQQVAGENSVLTFESTKAIANKKLDVTIFESGVGQPNGSSLGMVYTGIDVGAEWTYPQGPRYTFPDRGTLVGSYNLEITGIPALYSFIVSDKFGATINNNSYAFDTGKITANPFIFSNDNSHFLSINTGTGNTKYAIVDNLTANSNITVDYSSFKDFDKNLTLTYPGSQTVIASVVGYKTGSPINWSSYQIQPFEHKDLSLSQLNIGLLNSFANYSFDITVYEFRYLAVGPAPSSITYVDPSSFTTTGTTIDDYSIAGSSFLFRNAMYNSSNCVFNYYAPQGYMTKHHDPISPDIASKYSIDVSTLKFFATQVFLKGRSYSEWIQSQVDPTYDQTLPFEQATVIVGVQ